MKRNTAGNVSPFAQGDLLEELGFMGKKSTGTEIISGIYEFSPDCDTRLQRI